MTPAQKIALAGSLMYGTRWQVEMARALKVGDRRVRAWMSGEEPVPDGVWQDVTELLRDRKIDIGKAIDTLRRQEQD